MIEQFIWTIDETLIGSTNPVQNRLESNGNGNGNKWYSAFPKFQDWNRTIRCSLVSYQDIQSLIFLNMIDPQPLPCSTFKMK